MAILVQAGLGTVVGEVFSRVGVSAWIVIIDGALQPPDWFARGHFYILPERGLNGIRGVCDAVGVLRCGRRFRYDCWSDGAFLGPRTNARHLES